VAEVKEICQLRNDVYRNQWITFAYWSISQQLKKLIGDNANWCTFSTWSSRTIGENLRLEETSRRVRELIDSPDTSTSDDDDDLLWRVQYRVSTRDDGAAQRVLALGNHLIFCEIGLAVANFLEWANGSDDDWETYRAGIKPSGATDLFPAADVEQLRSGMECYYRAKTATDPVTQAELVLRGNLLLAAYEQWRADAMLKVALDPFPGHFLRVVQAHRRLPKCRCQAPGRHGRYGTTRRSCVQWPRSSGRA
jgi:hypothetical protein